jgi:hypothetical protein
VFFLYGKSSYNFLQYFQIIKTPFHKELLNTVEIICVICMVTVSASRKQEVKYNYFPATSKIGVWMVTAKKIKYDEENCRPIHIRNI